MSEPNGYLIHGTAFSSKEAAFKALVSNHEQESWFQKIWDEDAQPYYFESQTQLTIPKSAADILDKVFNDFEELKNSANSLMIRAIYEHYYPEDPFYKWCYRENDSYNISIIYLAGKALGVDLVKVVADEN